ncbi:MAG: hypothetical protein OER88_04380, partial [Planctomycetota bacterium]|nr:hypothetical protein [Planctomycetota bacterium]
GKTVANGYVIGQNGEFEIQGLKAGRYTLRAIRWTEDEKDRREATLPDIEAGADDVVIKFD